MARKVYNPETGKWEYVETAPVASTQQQGMVPNVPGIGGGPPRSSPMPANVAGALFQQLAGAEPETQKNLALAGTSYAGNLPFMGPVGAAVPAAMTYAFPTSTPGRAIGQNLGEAALQGLPGAKQASWLARIANNPAVRAGVGTLLGGRLGNRFDTEQSTTSQDIFDSGLSVGTTAVIGPILNRIALGKGTGEDNIADLMVQAKLQTQGPEEYIKSVEDSHAFRAMLVRSKSFALNQSNLYDKTLEAMFPADMHRDEIISTTKKISQWITDNPAAASKFNEGTLANFKGAAKIVDLEDAVKTPEKILQAAFGRGGDGDLVDPRLAVSAANLVHTALKDDPETAGKFVNSWMRRVFIYDSLITAKMSTKQAAKYGALTSGARKVRDLPGEDFARSSANQVLFGDDSPVYVFDGANFKDRLKQFGSDEMKMFLGAGNKAKGAESYAGLAALGDIMEILDPAAATPLAATIQNALGQQVAYSGRNMTFRMATGINSTTRHNLMQAGSLGLAVYGASAVALRGVDWMMETAVRNPAIIRSLRDGIFSRNTQQVNQIIRALATANEANEGPIDPPPNIQSLPNR